MAKLVNQKEVNVVRVDAEGNKIKGSEQTKSSVQWNLIGSNPATNGGWQLASPAEAEDEDEDEELESARTQYEELTGQKAGNKGLKTLQEAIAKAQNPS